MSIATKVAAYKDAAGPVADLRLALPDSEAIALARETGGADCRHPSQLAEALAGLDALPARPTENEDAVVAWALAAKAARDAFWDAYEGTPVDQVTIVRRR